MRRGTRGREEAFESGTRRRGFAGVVRRGEREGSVDRRWKILRRLRRKAVLLVRGAERFRRDVTRVHPGRREQTSSSLTRRSLRTGVGEEARFYVHARFASDEDWTRRSGNLKAEGVEDLAGDVVGVGEGAALVGAAGGGEVEVEADGRVLLPKRLQEMALSIVLREGETKEERTLL